jgi:outer membrane receptor protein involved in Fe transport
MKQFAKSGLAFAISVACFSAVADQNQPVDKNDENLEKIIVTGQKLTKSLQETKESVAVFTNVLIEERNLETLSDLIIQTPGVTGDSYSFRIRGVRNTDGASAPNRGDLASVVVDGVTLSGWVKSEGAGQLWDVSQVEILRGPQSTNIGRNALAGAVIVNTNDPVYYNEGSVRVGFGEYGKQELNGMANFNIVEDVAAVRFSLENTKSDGFVNNITRDEDDYGNAENAIYRMKFLYQPTDNLKTVLSYQRVESVYGLETTITGGEFNKGDRISIAGDDSTFETDANLLSLNIDYDINDE